MSLQSRPITELMTESAFYALMQEWLAGWFDGQAHVVGANGAIMFPRALLSFGQSEAAAQPVADPRKGTTAGQHTDPGVEIRTVMLPRMELAHQNNSVLYAGRLVTDYVVLNFWVQASVPGKGQAQKLAQETGELLKAILANPEARFALAEKGVTHLTPQMPQWIPAATYAKRLVACGAQLQYPVQFGDWVPTPPVDPGGSNNVESYAMTTTETFLNENVVTPGDYLIGDPSWPAVKVLVNARVRARAPATTPVTLEMEVGGVLTGKQLVIPVGSGEVTAGPVTLNWSLPKGTEVRWKCVGGPVLPEDSAWRIQVIMTVG